jgi:hypothetical protein
MTKLEERMVSTFQPLVKVKNDHEAAECSVRTLCQDTTALQARLRDAEQRLTVVAALLARLLGKQ